MSKPRIETADSFPVSLFIAGDYEQACKSAREYCDQYKWCFTVTKTSYVYKGGQEDGVIIGLINYPRFPNDGETIMNHAFELGKKLIVDLNQQSFSVQGPNKTVWVSYRPEDVINE